MQPNPTPNASAPEAVATPMRPLMTVTLDQTLTRLRLLLDWARGEDEDELMIFTAEVEAIVAGADEKDALIGGIQALRAERDLANGERDAARADADRLRDRLNSLSMVWDDGGRPPAGDPLDEGDR